MSKGKDTSTSSCLLRRHWSRFKVRLTRTGLIAYEPRTAIAIRLDRRETQEFLGRGIQFDCLDDFAEVVHLEIAARCQLECPYCYVGHEGQHELSTAAWKRIITDLAVYGTFQVTFGGGEPTLRDDLKELALYVRRRGLNLCMTTNGVTLHSIESDVLCLFNQINVSYHHAAPSGTLVKALTQLQRCRVLAGINLLVTQEYCGEIDSIADTARLFNADLVLLSAKGVSDAVEPQQVFADAKRLHTEGVRVAIDGLSCRGVLAEFCMQKVRFCTVDARGTVMPCSFVREPMGNLLERPFAHIWRSRGNQVPCPYVKGGGGTQ